MRGAWAAADQGRRGVRLQKREPDSASPLATLPHPAGAGCGAEPGCGRWGPKTFKGVQSHVHFGRLVQ